MIRISIMLTEQQLDLLKRQSRLRHKTIAELVRDALDPMSARQYLKARGIPLVVQELGDISMDAK